MLWKNFGVRVEWWVLCLGLMILKVLSFRKRRGIEETGREEKGKKRKGTERREGKIRWALPTSPLQQEQPVFHSLWSLKKSQVML